MTAKLHAGRIRFEDGSMGAVVGGLFEKDELTPDRDVFLALVPHPQRRNKRLLRN